MRLSLKQLGVIIGILGVVCITLWNQIQAWSPTDILQVSFLNVGQGDSIYIRAPNGNDVIIDGGPDSSITDLTKVLPLMDRDIDLMIETHPDKDHIAGLPNIFEQYQVNNFLHSEISSESTFDEQLQESAAREPSMKDIISRRGQRLIIDDQYGVYIDVLFPDQNTENFKETNAASTIVRLVYGESSFLLTGDAYIENEEFLVKTDGNKLQSDVLKLGHHGSKTSSSDLFLDTVQPDYVIVSAGKNNSYHHPATSVVERVKKRNIEILSTIDLGTITFETNGKDIWIK